VNVSKVFSVLSIPARVTVVVFCLFGVAYELPKYLTQWSLSSNPIESSVLPFLAVLWVVVSLTIFAFESQGSLTSEGVNEKK
jgi:amino acid permease